MATDVQTKNITDLLASFPEDQRHRVADRWRVHQQREALIQSPSFWKRLWLFLTLIGPGILVMIADNDAGGVIICPNRRRLRNRIFHSVSHPHGPRGLCGAGDDRPSWRSDTPRACRNGMGSLWPFLGRLFPLRSGRHQHPHPRYGIHRYYYRYEAFWRTPGFLIFVPLAIASHPHWGQVVRALGSWYIPAGIAVSGFVYVILANLGTTIAPWMLFFQQSSVVDKGLTEKDIPIGQADTAIGTILMELVAIALVTLTGSWVYGLSGAGDFGIHRIMAALVHSPIGSVGTALFGLGLVEAGLIAAIAITASTFWAVGEALKLPRGINLRPQHALPFYLSGLLGTALAALIVLIPHAPLGFLNLTVQVVASIFMPAAMMFLLMLLNDHEIMGQHVNRPWQNMAAFSIVGLLIIANGLYGFTVVFPHAL